MKTKIELLLHHFAFFYTESPSESINFHFPKNKCFIKPIFIQCIIPYSNAEVNTLPTADFWRVWDIGIRWNMGEMVLLLFLFDLIRELKYLSNVYHSTLFQFISNLYFSNFTYLNISLSPEVDGGRGYLLHYRVFHLNFAQQWI